MVGFKYKVSSMQQMFKDGTFNVKDPDDNQKNNVALEKISKEDKQIQQFCEITAADTPIMYDLSSVEEFRTDEAKVPAGSFLIVDTTAGTYKKVAEDDRKGDKREVIGIVPVVTTAANALFAQSLIKTDIEDVKYIETLKGDRLNTLNANGRSNDGLLASDFASRLNTEGKWYFQKFDFMTTTVKVISKAATITDLSCDTTAVVKVINDDGDECETKMRIGDVFHRYELSGGNYLSSLEPKCFANKETFTPVVDDDGTISCWSGIVIGPKPVQDYSMGELTNLTAHIDAITEDAAFASAFVQVNEWKGVDGDDSIPDTLALDANNYFASIQPAADGEGFDAEHLKDIGVIVYRTYLDPSEGNKVSYEPVEAYCGSLYKDDKDPNTGVTKFIDTIINSQSQYINFFSNCFSSTKTKKEYLEEVDILYAKPSVGASLGFYEEMTKKTISVSKSIYDGMNKAFDKVSNINERDIDIVCDAGLANIASYMKAIYGDAGEYDLTVTDDLGNSLLGMWKATDSTSAPVKTWKTVEQKFDNFCKNVRKDCMFIADGLRPLVLQGQKKIIRPSKPANTLDKDVIPYIKCLTGLNTSYGAGYMDWFEQADDYTGDFFWCPPSIKAMGVYVNTDVNFNYWDAPAGLNRGIIAATDVAFSPIASQADLIYDKSWNYAVNYPNDGIVLEGQKTLQVKPSALDRVNVRRLCLRLERAVGKVLRYFLYEAHTAYTRQRVVDAITPYFRSA